MANTSMQFLKRIRRYALSAAYLADQHEVYSHIELKDVQSIKQDLEQAMNFVNDLIDSLEKGK